jgi:drug/metabolite transporter (DMT)-like permease
VPASRPVETVALTLLALVAFAFNSILTRMALGAHEIDAMSYTAIRLASGAMMLTLLVRLQSGAFTPLRGRGLRGASILFFYAVPFSLAYLRLGAAVGALVLFGTVQITMIVWGIARGERPGARTWVGLALAAAGLMWLTLPSATSPDPWGAALMAIAGIGWGAYSLTGITAADPLAANARSFVWALPPAFLLCLLTLDSLSATARGLVLGAVAGGVTSGLGYVIWYRALRGLSATQAAIVQLSVPVIAAVGAVALLHEAPSARLGASTVAVLGGLALVISGRPLRSSG